MTGRNIRFILNQTGYDDIFAIKVNEVKKMFKFCDVPENESWKIDFIREITTKQTNLKIDDDLMTVEELDGILEYLTIS